MNKMVWFIGGGLLGWYLGTQHEEKTRKLYNKLKSEARELKLELEEKIAENEDLKSSMRD